MRFRRAFVFGVNCSAADGPLGGVWKLDPAEADEQIADVVIWGKTLHKVLISQEVKDIRGRDKVRFLFGLVGHFEQFTDDFRRGAWVL